MRGSTAYLFAAAMGVAALSVAGAAKADPKDYRFEAVQPNVQASSETPIAVRLVHLPDKMPVKDAVIFSTRMEMPMEGMAPMTTAIKAVKSPMPGEYHFLTNFSMEGPWALTLAAKVQGEAGTVTGTVPFVAR